VNHYRFVAHQMLATFVITPDALRSRVGGSSAEDRTERLQCRVDPVVLIHRCHAVPLDARNKEKDEYALACDGYSGDLHSRSI